MKGLFPQYYELPRRDFDGIWREALFVFDANVLLNLYRYRAATKDELLSVLTKLADRVWIPFQVALEFQRNRLGVIAEQNRRFSEVEKTIREAQLGLTNALEALQLQKRHSLINPQKLTEGFTKLVDEFIQELNTLKKAQQGLTEIDQLKQQIESIFDGRVGAPPENQAWLDGLYKEAEERFKKRLPPGYEDASKSKGEGDIHCDGGLVYQKKYGDYIVWRQLLDHAKANKKKSVIYVTDDNKADWWLIISENGPKTVGPRTELIDDARLYAGVDSFLMYKPEGFLSYAKDFLKATISDETLQEVRDVSTVKNPTLTSEVLGIHRLTKDHQYFVAASVKSWLLTKFDSVFENAGFPDLIASKTGRVYGFEIWIVSGGTQWYRRLREVIKRASESISEAPFHEFSIVIVSEDLGVLEDAKNAISRISIPIQEIPASLRVVLGLVDLTRSNSDAFSPYEDQSMMNYLL